MNSKGSSGYLKLLKSNPDFKHLWYGQVVSELGDWLNSMAIYALILNISGSGMALAAVMMAKLLPMVVVSPLAGVVVDRTSRKRLMIATDVMRFFVVLGFLFVHTGDDLWLLYTLTVMEISLAGFFEPARSAIIPSLVKREDLVTANALSGSTWSVMLSFGAAAGGVLVALFGIKVAFILDAVTFLFSGWFISRIRLVEKKPESEDPAEPRKGGFADLKEGFQYLRSEPLILALSLLKPGMAVVGGLMTLIPLLASQFLKGSAAISLGIGALYSARGIGAALGPVVVRKLFGDSSNVLRNAIACSFFLGAVFYFILSLTVTLWTASLAIGLATLFGSIIWVFSSSLIHLEADKNYLGRVFSTELALLTLVMGISNGMVGFAVDKLKFSPQRVALGIAGMAVVPGILWVAFLIFLRNRFKEGKCVGTYCPVDPSGFNIAPTEPVKSD